ncbi:MAG: right-handed parallel beta-helix repeat-containing protein, partial [Paludibacteraceae bacterium]|nr:right-handed parallel beta-helix repeat-containing protein [Paludibacteraceae bacterium]
MKKNLFLASLLLLWLASTPAIATVFTVTTLDDNANNGAPTAGSLRWAITQVDDAANAANAPHTINFSVTGTINMGGVEFWGISQQVTINGTGITLNAGGAANGLKIENANAAGTIIDGLTINNVSNNGISNWAAANVTVRNCVIGLTAANGTRLLTGNANVGINMDGAVTQGFVIRNCTIAGFGSSQITASNSKGQIDNCILGTNSNSEACPAPSNTGHGIDLTNCTVSDITNCLISGNPHCGIHLNACNNIGIRGCYIGTNLDGTAKVGNGQHGIMMIAGCNNITIGGTGAASDYNIIAGNASIGVFIQDGSSHNQIVMKYSYIGTNPSLANLGNGRSGAEIHDTEYLTIDHATFGKNDVQGVCIEAGCRKVNITNSTIVDNISKGIQVQNIAANATDFVNISNNTIYDNGWRQDNEGGSGIMLNSGVSGVNVTNNTIYNNCEGGLYINGGSNANNVTGNTIYDNNIANIWISNASCDNVITSNTIYGGKLTAIHGGIKNWYTFPDNGAHAGSGILVEGASLRNVLNKVGEENRIYCNAGLPIDLNKSNHVISSDPGNNNVETPTINPGSSTVNSIKGTGKSGATVYIYDNTDASCDCAGGYTCIGTATVDGSGNWTCTPNVTPTSLAKIAVMLVTSANNSSEFTDCCLVQGGTLAKKDANPVCAGASFVMTMTDAFGASFELQRSTTENGTYTTVATVTSGTEITAPATTAGTYWYRLRVTNGAGCEAISNKISVVTNALPTASIDGDAAVCQNGTLTLTGSGAANYSWNGGAYTTTATYSVNTASASTPTITLKVKDGNGCESAEVSKTVTVNALPTASIDGDAAVCQNGTLTLTGSGADNYSWNGGAYSTTATYSVNTASASTPTITLKVKDGNGCESAEESKTVTVNALPNAS